MPEGVSPQAGRRGQRKQYSTDREDRSNRQDLQKTRKQESASPKRPKARSRRLSGTKLPAMKGSGAEGVAEAIQCRPRRQL